MQNFSIGHRILKYTQFCSRNRIFWWRHCSHACHNLVPRRAPSKKPLYEVGVYHWPLYNIICYIEVSGVYSEWCAYRSESQMATRVLYISQAFFENWNLMKISILSHRNAWWHVCPHLFSGNLLNLIFLL